MQSTPAVLLIVGAVLTGGAAHAEVERAAVMPLLGKRVQTETVQILDELLLNEVHQITGGRMDIIGASDINAMLGLEKMKDAVGCEDVACAAELGGALGVTYIVAGTVSRLGGEITISLKFLNTLDQRVENRAASTFADDESLFRQGLHEAVAQLFGNEGTASRPLAEPATQPTTVAVKAQPVYSVGTAVALSLLPGGGMFYVDRSGWGIVYGALWVVGGLVGALFNPAVLGGSMWIVGDVVFLIGIVGSMIHSGGIASDSAATAANGPTMPADAAQSHIDRFTRRHELVIPLLRLPF